MDLSDADFTAIRAQLRAAWRRAHPLQSRDMMPVAILNAERPTTVHAETMLTELAMSHGDLAQLLRQALKAAYPGPNTYVWAKDVYDDSVVYELDTNEQTTLYQRSYAVVDGAVTFGEPVKVVAVTQYVPVDEAERGDITESVTSDLIPLSEKAVKQDGTIALRIIAPGQGSSGYYPADMLKRDGPKVFTAGLHMYADHPSLSEESDRPERSIKDLVGTLTSDARWEDAGAAGPGLYAEAKLRGDVAPLIEDLAPHIGVSIRALGTAGTREIDGQKTRTIEAITQAKSVDFVTVPGAGGRVLDLIEAARKGYTPAPTGTEDDVSKEELEEAQRKIDEQAAKITELTAWKESQERREADAALMREAGTVVDDTLATLTLFPAVAKRIRPQLVLNAPIKDGTLDKAALQAKVKEAARVENEYLASITGNSGAVTGMGGEPPKPKDVPALEESDKRIAEALKGI